ncbi:glycerophosphoryl diester phosphodiesterase [Peptoniphilus olsenii]|uniref:Glycerophosphoryl diester phosphodiesterase n=1 Tax=Peptoniphilus olsenii TaxID=411570 RepID=A0ABV2JDR9_9FIRM
MKIYAHRGFSSKFIENTKSSFEACVDLNIHGIEIDVQYSLDKKVVVIHDEDTKRLLGIKNFIKDMTYNELSKLNVLDGHEKPILLEEYLNIIEDTSLVTNVELKTSVFEYDGIERDVFNIFKKRNMLHRLLISSFNHNSLIKFRKLTSDVPIACLESSRLIEPWEYLYNYGIDYFHPLYMTMDKETVDKLHDKNIKVNVWTVNDKKSYNCMKKIGVDGVITNYPDLQFE